jgi:hypothetical protein
MTVKIKKEVSGKKYASGGLPKKGSVYEKFLVDVGNSPSLTGDNLKVSLSHKHVAAKIVTEKKISGQTVSKGETTEPVLQAVASGPNYAKVGCSGGRTMVPAPYESVKISVWLEIPCPNDPVAITEAYDYVSDWVSSKLQEAEAAFKGEPPKTVTVAAYPSGTAGDPTAGYTKIESLGGGGSGGFVASVPKTVKLNPGETVSFKAGDLNLTKA